MHGKFDKIFEEIAEENIPRQSAAARRTIFINVPLLRTARQRMEAARNLPPISQLFGQVWQKGELHFLFGDTGSGKSIMGVQIADALSKGRSVLPGLPNENEPMRVIYHDYELSDRQFFQRYTSDNGQDYEFSDNLFIDNLDWPLLMRENPATPFVELIQEKIRYDIDIHQAQVLIIDNITFLHVHNSTDTQTALEVMRFLDSIKREFNISVLVFAHCPKVALNTPITINHFAGSKMLPNFADGVSAIGKSEQGANIRYIKQIKPSRNGQMIYDRDNVLTLQLTTSDNFLHFEFLRLESEFKHLKINENEIDDRKLEVIDLHRAGLSTREIAEKIKISKSTVANIIKKNDDEHPF